MRGALRFAVAAFAGSLAALAPPGEARARDVTVRWTHAEPELVSSFRLYVREGEGAPELLVYEGLPPVVGGVYAQPVSVSDTVPSTVVATAVGEAGESPFSNEIDVPLPAVCGDGWLAPTEQCDDGNALSGDGCRADCTIEVCGDGRLDPGEQCDDGNALSGDGCRADCTLEVCGDGRLDPGEQCDDGNALAGDGCEACRLVEAPRCGDGIVQPGEQCDDGNALAGDGCRADCTVEVCGDGRLDPGEQCDDGNLVSGDGCGACVIEHAPTCGDGRIDPGEQCDDGNDVAGDGCRADCTVEVCGDGQLDPGEQCDDGNTASGDGCRADCTLETCGDGRLDPGEACDDGNLVGGDGCSAQCTLERSEGLPFLLDAGGDGSYVDAAGGRWIADEPYVSGGTVHAAPTAEIAGTTLDPLYRRWREGDPVQGLRVEIPVPGLGPYQVRLHFAEMTEAGTRIFDVDVEGVSYLADVDVFRAAGGLQRAWVYETTVLVDDGWITIDLLPVQGAPFISAVEVRESQSSPLPAPKLPPDCTPSDPSGNCF